MQTTPKEMLVEITNKCNHACAFCRHNTMEPVYGEIDPTLLKRVMQEAYNMGVRRIGLYLTGEMFLCKNLITHIKNAKETGYTYIYADTNGALATKENMKSVLLAGLDSIKFSINSGTRETYREIHGRDDFDKVMQNLIDCHSLKTELNKDFKLMVSFIVTSKTESEVENFKLRIEKYIDYFMAHGAVVTPETINLLPTEEKYKPAQISIPCDMVFNRIHVTWDGKLTACCADFNHELIIGDLNTYSLEEAWKSEEAAQLRAKHLSGNLSGTLCEECVKNRKLQLSK